MKFKNESALLAGHAPAVLTEKILVRGIHLTLTPALRTAVFEKCARLLRHEDHLVRIRIDLEHDQTKHDQARFVAKGRIEISGPDLIAALDSDDAYKSLDLLIDRLDRMLRERSRSRADRRNDRPAGAEFRDQLAAED
jgi:putative sigma-54 modulation protein